MFPEHFFLSPLTDVPSTLLLLSLVTPYNKSNSRRDYIAEFSLYKTPACINKKRNKNHTHDEYLYQRWTNPTIHKPTTTTATPNLDSIPKDDPSITPTLIGYSFYP